jgi:hypothetical protein
MIPACKMSPPAASKRPPTGALLLSSGALQQLAAGSEGERAAVPALLNGLLANYAAAAALQDSLAVEEAASQTQTQVRQQLLAPLAMFVSGLPCQYASTPCILWRAGYNALTFGAHCHAAAPQPVHIS